MFRDKLRTSLYETRAREVCGRLLAGCGVEVDLVVVHYDDLSDDWRITRLDVVYGGDMTFEVLARVAAAFGTRKIDLGCDCGTGSDPCHQRELYVRDPVLSIAHC